MFRKIVIIGLGLIGGSMARAIRKNGLCDELWGVGRTEATLQQAIGDGVIDAYSQEPSVYCADADLVIIGVPGLTVGPVLEQISPYLEAQTLVTDVASVKASTELAVRRILADRAGQFIPGHPIAGSERSGYAASREELFSDRRVILTPLPENSQANVERIRGLWAAMGAEVLTMSVPHHDEVLAATSHLPHLLAYALVDTLSRQGTSEEIFRYAAGGFRDFTRIASSDPVMWRDIFVANGPATIRVLDEYMAELMRLRQALDESDGPFLHTVFTRAKNSRDKFMQQRYPQQAPAEAHDLSYLVQPGGALTGEARVPGDKSISHRSIMLGSLAEGTTTVEGFLEGEDSLATLAAFRAMGVDIEGPDEGRLRIQGVGLNGLKPPVAPLYMGNSGTAMRLMCGLLAAQSFPSTLTGDSSLSGRPMKRVAGPLAEMGARIGLSDKGTAPIQIIPSQLHAIKYHMPVASAQVKSCLILASLYTSGTTVITEPAPCRDHTERMLRGFGYPLEQNGDTLNITGGGSLKACHIDVPADISSAAFFLVGASIAPGSDLTLRHVGINPTRIGVINILRLMGADITILNEREAGGEPVADIRVRHAQLHGIEIPVDQVPLAIDEFPVLFVAAACAQGTSVLSGAEELRVKESDRIQVMADGLENLGVKLEVKADGIVIEGGDLGSGTVNSHGDHRIAMSFVMAGLRSQGQITILDCNNVATSFPGFVELATSAGCRVSTVKS